MAKGESFFFVFFLFCFFVLFFLFFCFFTCLLICGVLNAA